MAELKGGITISGSRVENTPVILDGRTSIYEEALEKGKIPAGTSYDEFLEGLAVKPAELKKAVKNEVNEQLEEKVNAAVAAAVSMLDLNRSTNPINPPPVPPVATDLSDDALNEIKKLLEGK